MKPEFVKDPIWRALPEDVQESVLDQGALLFRKGVEPEEAFWMALEGQRSFVEELFTFFDVGNPPRGVQWGALSSDDIYFRKNALNAILRAYFLSHHGHEDFLKCDDVPTLIETVLADRPRLKCAFCFERVIGTEENLLGSLKVHSRCQAKLLTLGETLWDIIDDEFQKARALGMGEEVSEAEVEYPEFLSIFGEGDEDVD
jgi:hypothetical protein